MGEALQNDCWIRSSGNGRYEEIVQDVVMLAHKIREYGGLINKQREDAIMLAANGKV